MSDACHGTGLSRSVPRQQKQLERVLLLEVPRRQLPKSHCSPDDVAEYVYDDNIVSNRKKLPRKIIMFSKITWNASVPLSMSSSM